MPTLRKLTVIGVFLAALVPSAYLAWTLRTMPHLGFYHDDSIYWVSARSLATGNGYRIESLPGSPAFGKSIRAFQKIFPLRRCLPG